MLSGNTTIIITNKNLTSSFLKKSVIALPQWTKKPKVHLRVIITWNGSCLSLKLNKTELKMQNLALINLLFSKHTVSQQQSSKSVGNSVHGGTCQNCQGCKTSTTKYAAIIIITNNDCCPWLMYGVDAVKPR